MVYYKRFMQMGILIAQEQKDSKNVIFGFDVERTGLDLTAGDINHMCEALAKSLNGDTTQYNGKYFKQAIATKNRVILEAY